MTRIRECVIHAPGTHRTKTDLSMDFCRMMLCAGRFCVASVCVPILWHDVNSRGA